MKLVYHDKISRWHCWPRRFTVMSNPGWRGFLIPVQQHFIRAIVFLACLCSAVNSSRVEAQSANDTMSALRVEIQKLREEIQALREELRSRTAPPAPAGVLAYDVERKGIQRSPEIYSTAAAGAVETQELPLEEAVPLLRAQVAEQSQTKVESNSRLPVKIFGALVSNTFFNTGEADWIDNPGVVLARKPSLPTGSFSSTLRQSRIGAIVNGPTIGSMKAHGLVEVDFYGGVPNFQTGQVMGIPRMLYGYVRLEGERTAFEAGQDQMILAPRNPTSFAARYFPDLYRSGNLYLRAPQIRVERLFAAGEASEFQAVGGVLAPVMGDFCSDSFAFITPNLGGERSRRPALQGRLAWRSKAGRDKAWEVGLSGHKGRGRFAKSDLEGCAEYGLLPQVRERLLSGSANSWAGAVDFDLQAKRLGFGGEWYVGRNINAFGGSLGQFAKSAGGFLEGRLKASERLEFNTGFGIDRPVQRRTFPALLIGNSSVFANATYQFMPELEVSLEYRRLSTLPNQGAARQNHHFNLAFAYSF